MTEPNPNVPPPQQPEGGSSVPPPASTPPSTPPVDYATPGGTGYPGAYIGPEPTQDDRTWGMLAHLSALVGFIGIPSFIGPLVVWLIKKDTMPFVNDQGKESLNFQITIFIALVIAALTICIGIGLILLPAVGIVALVFIIIASIAANKGEAYRYPFTLRLIK